MGPPLQIVYYLFLATPAPVPTIFDYYVLRPIYDVIGPRYQAAKFALRDRLGGGNFGITYEAVMKTRTQRLVYTNGECALCLYICGTIRVYWMKR